MKKAIWALLVVAAFIVSTTAVAFAEGGKVCGENGQGYVDQVQVQDPDPMP